jgi:hypothetical protein
VILTPFPLSIAWRGGIKRKCLVTPLYKAERVKKADFLTSPLHSVERGRG